MMILTRKVGQLLRMRTESGEQIDIQIESSSFRRVKFCIDAPQSVRFDLQTLEPPSPPFRPSSSAATGLTI